jgi:hypothetical protein
MPAYEEEDTCMSYEEDAKVREHTVLQMSVSIQASAVP